MGVKSFAFVCAGLIAGWPATAAVGADDLGKLLDRVGGSVVSVKAYNPNGNAVGQGSGFVVSKDGLVVTALHVVEPAAVVELKTADGDIVNAGTIAAVDREWDLALLRADGFDVKPLDLAREGTAKADTAVFVIESPFGFNQIASEGVVVALHPHAGRDDLLQITNEITPGSSGGPVLDAKGRVLGVVQSIVRGGEAVTFAIPGQVVARLRESANGAPAVRELSQFSPEARSVRDALANVRPEIEKSCAPEALDLIDGVITDAISSGVDIYNSGDHLGCYRLYEASGYKLMFLLEDRCDPASALLRKAIREAGRTVIPGGYDSVPAAQAWIMRIAFDSLLGDRGPPSVLGGQPDSRQPPSLE
jgi:S1-C subfamily serine protease